MGRYINTGNAGFQSCRNGEYVDKSGLISIVNGTLFTERRFSCVTRCRRFGKSMAAKMLNAYYDQSCDSRSLFADLQIAQDASFEQHLNKYPVIYLDLTTFTAEKEADIVNRMDGELLADVSKVYADLVLIPRKNVASPAIVVELKYHQAVDTAIAQIKRREYSAKVAQYVGNLLLVGISYDRETKQHACRIEKYVSE